MKRLVICCDGTWNRPDSAHVTNIEKIARTIETNQGACGGVQQLVLYLSGVGSGYLADRLLGGVFGLGLFANIRAGYRFLALNYEDGDEIFVFGFSRGAYTARSLVGMIARVGLLTRRALIADKLSEAVERYRQREEETTAFGDSDEEFRRDHCHDDVQVRFLGVFDTVGALGVPVAWGRRHQFHDVRLGPTIRCARQALAIDERRMKFEPCLWESDPDRSAEDREDLASRVQQVWFEGVHSDVGGGYAETGLSDTTLLWMVVEAHAQGLTFDQELLGTYVASGSSAVRHDSLTAFFRLHNALTLVRVPRRRRDDHFQGTWRRLEAARALTVRLASSAVTHHEEDRTYGRVNLVPVADGPGGETLSVAVVALPERSLASINTSLAGRGADLVISRPDASSAS